MEPIGEKCGLSRGCRCQYLVRRQPNSVDQRRNIACGIIRMGLDEYGIPQNIQRSAAHIRRIFHSALLIFGQSKRVQGGVMCSQMVEDRIPFRVHVPSGF